MAVREWRAGRRSEWGTNSVAKLISKTVASPRHIKSGLRAHSAQSQHHDDRERTRPRGRVRRGARNADCVTPAARGGDGTVS